MTRRLVLVVLAILVIAAAPADARGGHGSHGHRGHHHHHFRSFGGFYSAIPLNYPCWWEPEHWVDQLYGDKFGNTTVVREKIPGQWLCW